MQSSSQTQALDYGENRTAVAKATRDEAPRSPMLRSVPVSDRTPMRTADQSRPRRQTCSCEVSNIRPLRARGLLSTGTRIPPTIASSVGEAVKPRTLFGDERRVSVDRHRRGCWAEGATRRPDFCHCHSRPPSGRWLARTHCRLSLAREGSTWRPRPSQCRDSSIGEAPGPVVSGVIQMCESHISGRWRRRRAVSRPRLLQRS